MKLTEKYMETVKAFQGDLRAVRDRFAPEFTRIEKFRDSLNYEREMDFYRGKRDEALAGVRREYEAKLADTVNDMERRYLSRPASIPSADELRLLQALQMREHLTMDELRQAGETLKGSPVALGVLRELCHKHGHMLALQEELSGDTVQRTINSLRRSGESYVAHAIDPDTDGKQAVDGGDWTLFRLSQAPADVADCMRIFGYCSDYAGFSEAVDDEG